MPSAKAARPVLYSNPEYEARKAARRPLTHSQAVDECAFLSAQYRTMWPRKADMAIDLKALFAALHAAKVPFVLTGLHGISSWMGRPRATHDVDLLVKAGRNHARAVNAIKKLYPQLETHHVDYLTAFFVPGETESVIDVSAPARADNEATLRTAVWVEDDKGKYRVPTLEAALANKYGAMLSLGREVGRRAQDAVDFYWMVIHSSDPGREPINLEILAELGEMVWPGGGGAELLQLVERAKAGEVPRPMDKPGR